MSNLNTSTAASIQPIPVTTLSLCDNERWFAVHSQPFAEKRAAGNLHMQGFRTFTPKRRKTVRHARQVRTIDAPLFPRYLFVVLDMARDQWRSVNGTFGVSRLVMRGDAPQPVPHGLVETLITSTDDDGFLTATERLKPGSTVRLMAGPFAEELAILDSLNDAGRVQLFLNILGRQVRITTEARNVMPVA